MYFCPAHNPTRFPIKSKTVGGHVAYAEGLNHLNLNDPDANHDKYTKWAGSVKSLPVVIKQKVSVSRLSQGN